MRKIGRFEITIGMLLYIFIFGCSFLLSSFVWELLSFLIIMSELKLTLISFIVFCFSLVSLNIFILRVFLYFFPLKEGDVPVGSRQEKIYHIYVLLHFFVLHLVSRSNLLPIPLTRLFYSSLGAKMGDNSYASGIIFDCQFVKIGNNCILGQSSLICPHLMDGRNLSHFPIVIGNNVTIGTHSVVFGGAYIEDDSIVGANSLVTKGTHIKKNEIWGGVPAKLISLRQ